MTGEADALETFALALLQSRRDTGFNAQIDKPLFDFAL